MFLSTKENFGEENLEFAIEQTDILSAKTNRFINDLSTNIIPFFSADRSLDRHSNVAIATMNKCKHIYQQCKDKIESIETFEANKRLFEESRNCLSKRLNEFEKRFAKIIIPNSSNLLEIKSELDALQKLHSELSDETMCIVESLKTFDVIERVSKLNASIDEATSSLQTKYLAACRDREDLLDTLHEELLWLREEIKIEEDQPVAELEKIEQQLVNYAVIKKNLDGWSHRFDAFKSENGGWLRGAFECNDADDANDRNGGMEIDQFASDLIENFDATVNDRDGKKFGENVAILNGISLDPLAEMIVEVDSLHRGLDDQVAEQLAALEALFKSCSVFETSIRMAEDGIGRLHEIVKSNFVASKKVGDILFDNINDTSTDDALTENDLNVEKEKISGSNIVKLNKQLDECRSSVGDCKAHSDELKNITDETNHELIDARISNLNQKLLNAEEKIVSVSDNFSDNRKTLSNFLEVMSRVEQWLHPAIKRCGEFGAIALEMRAVKIQMEEVKMMKREISPKISDIEQLVDLHQEMTTPFRTKLNDTIVEDQFDNDTGNLLKTAENTININSGAIASTYKNVEVDNIIENWNKLVALLSSREEDLVGRLSTIQNLDLTLDDLQGDLQHLEAEVSLLSGTSTEASLQNIDLLERTIRGYGPTVEAMDRRIIILAEETGNKPENMSIGRKIAEVKELLASALESASKVRNDVEQQTYEVRDYATGIILVTKKLEDNFEVLIGQEPLGSLPSTAQASSNKFKKFCVELAENLDVADMLLRNGTEMTHRCRGAVARQLKQKLIALESVAKKVRLAADKERERVEGHVRRVLIYGSAVERHQQWIDGANAKMKSSVRQSKLPDRLKLQIAEHIDLSRELQTACERQKNIELTAAYLRQQGRQADGQMLGMSLAQCRMAWRRLQRRVEERDRRLQIGSRDARRFEKLRTDLINFLTDLQNKIDDVSSDNLTNPKKSLDILKSLQHEMMADRQPMFYRCLQRGRDLRDRCTPKDEEKGELNSMLEDVRGRWRGATRALDASIRKQKMAALADQKQSDWLKHLIDEISKVKSKLSENNYTRGDLTTVHKLIDNNNLLTDMTNSHLQMLSNIDKQSIDGNQLKELKEAILTNQRTCKQTSDQLEDALKIALEFEDGDTRLSGALEEMIGDLHATIGGLKNNYFNRTDMNKFVGCLAERIGEVEGVMERVEVLAGDILENCDKNCSAVVHKNIDALRSKFHMAERLVGTFSSSLANRESEVDNQNIALTDLEAWVEGARRLASNWHRNDDVMERADHLLREHLEFHGVLTKKKKVPTATLR